MTTEIKNEKSTKTEKVAVLKIATVFQELAQKGAKDRGDLAKKIVEFLKNKGVTINVKGKPIVEAKVKQQISAMIRDIKMARGKANQSWWSKFSVEETDTLVKIVAKA